MVSRKHGDVIPPDVVIQAVDSRISAVRTQSIDFSFNELADMYSDQELIIDPEFQRLFRWSEGAQSRFIESLLLELPIPPIFLIEREDRTYELIDGLQRFSSYLHFRGQLLSPAGQLEQALVLSDCDIVRELNGATLQDLPRSLEIKLKRSYVRAEILRKESAPRLRYYMFKRLNTGGEQLSEQEVRNATIRLLSNDFNQFIISLSENDDFQYCIGIISDGQRSRRFDHELVLRFFAFKNYIEGYRHDVAGFLTEYMESISDPTDQTHDFDYEHEREIFKTTFKALRLLSAESGVNDRIFGSVLPKTSAPRGQFSVYHYEGIVLGLQAVLARIDLENSGQITELAVALREGKADPEFLASTGAGKNDSRPLKDRVTFFARKFGEAVP